MSEYYPTVFRPGTKLPKQTVNFLITQGGVGDYVCLLSVLEWLANNHPQIDGRVYVAEWFIPIAENVLKKFPDWRVQEKSRFNDKKMKSRPTQMPFHRPINRVGAHAIDLGFIYYLNMTPAPPDAFYSRLDFSGYDFGEPGHPYAVMTPGASNLPKTLKPKSFNAIKNHLLDLGIIPLFLGNVSFREEAPTFHKDYDFSGGIDLTNETTLLQAAGLMAKAKLVVGLDNGLLHLAAMTETPIVYGYTISSVEHTQPRRQSGNIYNIHPNLESLPCTFCQSRMRMINHDFKDCLYGDNLCTDVLDKPERWCEIIDTALKAS